MQIKGDTMSEEIKKKYYYHNFFIWSINIWKHCLWIQIFIPLLFFFLFFSFLYKNISLLAVLHVTVSCCISRSPDYLVHTSCNNSALHKTHYQGHRRTSIYWETKKNWSLCLEIFVHCTHGIWLKDEYSTCVTSPFESCSGLCLIKCTYFKDQFIYCNCDIDKCLPLLWITITKLQTIDFL